MGFVLKFGFRVWGLGLDGLGFGVPNPVSAAGMPRRRNLYVSGLRYRD